MSGDRIARQSGEAHLVAVAVVAVASGVGGVIFGGVARYITHSKTAEALRNLGSIEVGSKNKFQQETDLSGTGVGPFVHSFCDSAAIPVPKDVPKGVAVTVPAAQWNVETWKCLKFSLNDAQRYQYDYKGKGTGVTATYTAIAHGDLNGNGKVSTFELKGAGSPTGDAVRVSLEIVDQDE